MFFVQSQLLNSSNMKTNYFRFSIACIMLFFVIIGCSKNDNSNKPASIPTVTTLVITNVTQTSAQSGGNISNDGGAAVNTRGICWSINANPTINDFKTSDSSGTGSFNSNISGLQPNTQYHVRAYATNNAGTAYGQDLVFTTTQVALPILTTTSATSITDTSLSTGGNISNDNGSSVISRGVCWSTSPNPTILLATKTNDGTGTGSFTSFVNGLGAATTYYLRSYATNSVGTAYGNEITFTTLGTLSTVNTSPVINIGLNSARSGGYVSNAGGSAISRGICWSTSPNPTITLTTKTINGLGVGTFVSDMTGLTQGTTYYVRAYATNMIGTAYGNELTFTTSAPPPTVISNSSVTNITNSSAVFGGTVTSDGGSFPVTARGVCWGTSPNPYVQGNSHTIDGTGLGTFTSSITGLTYGTTYYVRAYATNNIGTSYGSEVSFTTTAPFYIGQSYGGGKIFYIDASGVHGLIAANGDIYQSGGFGYKWYNGSYLNTNTNTYDGMWNTNNIIASQGNTGSYAAKACKDYNGGGFSDWFLPSQDQLNLMHSQKVILGMINLGFNSTYWSSTQQGQNFAYGQDFSNGQLFGYSKATELRVRPVRAF